MNNKFYLYIGTMALLLAMGVSSCGLLSPQSTGTDSYNRDLTKKQTLLVGTYTDRSEGIYSFSYDPRTLNVKHRSTLITPNPTSMALDRDRGIIYVANEQASDAMVSSLQLDGVSGRLTAINSSFTLGGAPYAIATDGKGKVVSANYASGSITLFFANETGLLGQPDWHIMLGQEGISHPSDLCFTPDGKELFVVDKGQDKVYHFNVSIKNPPLTIDVATTDLTKGSQPKHLIMEPNGRYAYLLTEQSPMVILYKHHRGRLNEVERHELGSDSASRGEHLALSPDGRHLYVSEMGSEGRVTIFKVNKSNSKLTKVGSQKVGSEPVFIAIHPSGRWVAVACRKANKVEFYRRDPESGLLQPMSDLKIDINQPACLLWTE
ncbi:6-phosphogluconolactonase [Chlamydia trachomatis]|nr:6-phosphogluconolactonase [Chlamydia trachomatis]